MAEYLTFPNKEALHKYADKLNNFSQGELVYLSDDNIYVMFDGENFIDAPTNTQVEGNGLNMNLYDLNKAIIAQLPVKCTLAEQQPARNLIDNFFQKHGHKHYMLLCKDISYYTIFKYQDTQMTDFKTLGYAVLDCLQAVGQFICADMVENDSAIEIWVRTPEDDNLCMYLFECEELIVTFGR